MKLADAIKYNNQPQLYVSLAAIPGTTGTRFYRHMFHHHGISADYVACECDDLASDLELAKDHVNGVSITMPFKTQLTEFVDQWADDRLTVANTLKVDKHRFIAYNCDLLALEKLLPEHTQGRTVVILGDGAMAQNVRLACAGARDIVTASRKTGTWENRHRACDVLINATSVGMTDQSPVSSVEQAGMVVDCIIGNTRLAYMASKADKPVITGNDIYLEQFKLQFAAYTGQIPDIQELQQLSKKIFNV